MSTIDTTATTSSTAARPGLRRRAARALRGALAAAALAGALTAAHQASAAVHDPPPGQWNFTLYQDANCETGLETWHSPSSISTTLVPSLSAYGINDTVSSWSVCNDLTVPIYVTLQFFQDANYGGSISTPATHERVSPGLCLTGNHMWMNDAVTSFILEVRGS